MNNKLTKYNESRWNKFCNKLKILLWNKKFDNIKTVNTSLDNNEINEKYEIEKKKFVELVTKFNDGNKKGNDLSIDEIKILIKYYEQENKKLDRIIEKQNRKINGLNLELNKVYQKAINLKK